MFNSFRSTTTACSAITLLVVFVTTLYLTVIIDRRRQDHSCICDQQQLLQSESTSTSTTSHQQLQSESTSTTSQKIPTTTTEYHRYVIDDHPSIRTIDITPNYPFYDNQLISYQNNIYLDKYHLHYCKIDKNMGSTMQALLCYIDDSRQYSRLFHDQSWGPGLMGTSCGASTVDGDLRKRFINAADNLQFFDEKSNIHHVAVIRHPVRRFISAFLDICGDKRRPKMTCYDCHMNMSCFLPKLHRDFLLHVLHLPLQRWTLDWHFFPQSWHCEFERYFHLYTFVRYERSESFWSALVKTLGSVGIERHFLKEIETKLRTKNAAHATFSVSGHYEKQLRSNPQLLEYIYKIYYLDFVWFNYAL